MKHPRQKFMIKVWGLLSLMLTFTSGCVGYIVLNPKANEYIKERGFLVYIFLILTLLGMIIHTCCKSVVSESPMNYLLLVYFNVVWTGMVAGMCAFSTPKVVLLAASMTAAMVLGLTLLGLSIKNEMSFAHGFMATCLMAVWPGVIFIVIDPTKTRTVVLAFVGTIFASVYIVIDTVKVMAAYGKGDEYIMGTIALYRDILVLFLSLLTILGASSR
jgi:FtsH-binding integral membrane protein